MAEESRYLMEADAGGPVLLDPFTVAEPRFRGTLPVGLLGTPQVAGPALSTVLGVTPTSITSLSSGVTLGTGGPNIRIGGQEVVGRQDIFGENITLVRDPITGEPTPLTSSVRDVSTTPGTPTTDTRPTSQIISETIESELARERSRLNRDLSKAELDALVDRVLAANTSPSRNIDLSPNTGSRAPGQFPLILPLPIDPALAAALTAASILLGSGGGGGAPSGSTGGGAGSGAGAGAGAGSGASTGGSASGGSGGTQTTTPPTTPESGDGRLILIGGQPGGPFVGPVAPPVTPTTPPARPPEGTTPTPGVGIVPVPVTPPSVTPPPPVAPPSVTPPPVTPPPVTPPPVTPPPSPPRSPESTTPTPPVAVVPVPATTPTTTPSSGGNISFTLNPAVATPITVRTPDLNREILREGRISAPALRDIAGSTLGSYGMLAGQPGQYDVAAFQNLLGSLAGYTPQLTRVATEQTIQGQRALREANIADVQRLSQAAMQSQRAANPELYAALGSYLPAAQGMLASDLARLQGGGRLTAEEVRSAQQAAREAGLARGREMDQSTIAAEVLNRDALMRAREAQSRANVQQSMQNVYGGIGAAQAATFNPFATLLGQQYGMQTANVGMNQALFGQGAGFTSGQFSNPFVQGLVNPYSAYAQDVYASNFNAANARAIAEANAAAAAQGADQQLLGSVAGQVFKYAIPAFGSIFSPSTTPTTSTNPRG